MTLAFRATASSPALPAGPPSVARGTAVFNVALTDTPYPMDVSAWSVAFGTTAGPAPATYADLNNAHVIRLSDFDSVTLAPNGSVTQLNARKTQSISDQTVGETLWLAFFEIAQTSIVGGSVPLATQSLGVL